MRWLKSATDKQWTIGVQGKQIVIPASDKKWLCMEEEVYNELSAQPVIKSLIKAKGIIVMNKKPIEAEDSVPELQEKTVTLQTKVADLETQLTEATNKVKELEAQLANAETDKNSALAELDAKASGIIAEKDTQIADLEAKVTKLEKKLKKSGGDEE